MDNETNNNKKKLPKKRKKNSTENENIILDTETKITNKKVKSNKQEENLYVPSQSELEISTNLQNSKQKSKRQLKRERKEEQLKTLKQEKESNFHMQILNYISKWQHHRNEWKFEKKKNMYIFNNLLNVDKIPNDIWSTVLQYISNSSGNIRKRTVQQALAVIEDANSDSEPQKYKRAREVLQFLDG